MGEHHDMTAWSWEQIGPREWVAIPPPAANPYNAGLDGKWEPCWEANYQADMLAASNAWEKFKHG
jgi:hypothetical protein